MRIVNNPRRTMMIVAVTVASMPLVAAAGNAGATGGRHIAPVRIGVVDESGMTLSRRR